MVRRTTVEETEPAPVVAREAVEVRGRRRHKLEDVVWFILAIIAAIIVVRFILLLFGARQGVPFVDFWYAISQPLVAPFAGIFGNDYSTYNNGSRLEAADLVALLIYSIVAYLIILGIRLLSPNTERRIDE